MHNFVKSLWALVLCFPMVTFAQSIPVFNANYDLYAKGLHVGVGKIVLTSPEAGRYKFHMEASPSGLTSLFTSESIVEDAFGRVDGNRVLPEHYQSIRSSRKRDLFEKITFDWKTKIAKTKERTKNDQIIDKEVKLQDESIDTLSLQLLVMLDLKRKNYRSTYSFVDDHRIKTYAITHHGIEILKTTLGNKNAYKISQQRVGSTRTTVMWFDVDQNFMPLQIIQLKSGKETLKMRIK